MFLKRRSRVTPFLVLILATTLAAQNSSKRSITHKDYDSFKSITSQKLSDDGKLLAYILQPQEGDSEVVLRTLATGAERREPIGSRPQATNTASEGEPVATEPGRPAAPGAAGARSAALSFTSDGKYLVFTANPPKAEMDKARREKKKPEEMPKPSLVIVPTAGGDAVRIDNVRGFQVAENNPTWLAYQKGSLTATDIPQREDAQDEDQGRARGAAPAANRREYGSELVLRNLSNQSERQFADVLEYLLAKDGATLVYAVSSKKEENNGVYAAATDGSESKALASGKGRYLRLAWDDAQKQLAFLSSKDDASSRQPKFKLYYWSRGSNVADAVVATDTAGIRSGWVIADRGVVNFSKDGERLYFATAPQRAERRPDPDATEEKVVADLWHWKDDNVQPMQKVRAEQDRTRSYRAAYIVASKQVIQLSDLTMQDLTFSDNSKLGIGTDDRDYRAMVEYDERHSDYYLVDTATGARTLVGRNLRGAMSSSPDSKWGVHFNGRDWVSYEFATGKQRNLTDGIGIAFYNEDHDTPGTRTSHGIAGWTKDSKYVLLNDRYDIWQVSPDGSSSKLLTDGVGRREKIQFRYVRFGEERPVGGGGFGGPDRGGAVIDSTKPLVLRAENLETRDTGFWEDRIDSNDPPKKLIMAAKAFTTPAKAKNADVVVLTATRFDEFGDLLVTDSKFSNLKKVSDANPQMKQMAWGTGELINFRNTDGTPLKAALYKPENFDPSKKYPMIVYIYERLSQSLHTFRAPAPATSINITYYTSNGYLVLTPDIAYSIGYPGQSAMKCVLPAVQSVVDKGFVDENAIGIQGHSWGGYQIAYMITQTNRFRAVAAGAPVANMTSAYDGIRWGTGLPRQFQYERTQSRIGGSLWEYPLRFLENSPIFQADRVKTPVLMVHNDGDDAVPWYQGIEYFLALRRLGKEAYLFNYNGEPHGLRKRINQKDYTMRMQQFFDHFLKGAPMPAWMERGIPYIDRETEKEQYRKPVEPQATGGGAQ